MKIAKILSFVFIFLLSGSALFFYSVYAKNAEQEKKFIEQQVRDVHQIAALLEEYKSKKGTYPFFDPTPAKEGYKKVGTLVGLASDDATKKLMNYPNPFRISSGKAFTPYLEKELSQVLERDIELPVDPHVTDRYAPNAYYVYLPPKDDEYMVLAFLYSPNEYTSELFNPHANVYAVSSSHVIGEMNFWKSAGIKPRLYKEIKRK